MNTNAVHASKGQGEKQYPCVREQRVAQVPFMSCNQAGALAKSSQAAAPARRRSSYSPMRHYFACDTR